MTASPAPVDPFTFPGSALKVQRMGYGAMRLTGPQIWGEPADRPAALAVLQEAMKLGINHIDTSDFYGPHVANQIIREALHPYPEGLVIVTKVGAKRGPDKSWLKALSDEDITSAVHDNIARLGVAAMDIVNLRVGETTGPNEASIAQPLRALVRLRDAGLVRHIGVSNVSRRQILEAQAITEIVCVQNHYNLAHRHDDALLDELAHQGIAYVPYFPLGGFQPLQSEVLERWAKNLQATSRQVALAWLLQRSPNILLIPGTSSVEHLRENVRAADLHLPADALAELDRVSTVAKA